MTNLDISIEQLKKVTSELAIEIHSESEEKKEVLKMLSCVFDMVEEIVIILNIDCETEYINPFAIEMIKNVSKTNIKKGDHICKEVFGENLPCSMCITKKAIETRKVVMDKFTSPSSKKTYTVMAIPLLYNGTAGAAIIMKEI